ncbi:MAG: pseudouridine synthase [Porticoccus sp.]|nr:pseudouridine synthase [Porticoccus sp.]MBQ0806795.1 pseudouridine synthase [Porticoccus sp.]
MQSKRARLDRFISEQMGINRRDVRPLLAQKRIVVDGSPATDINHVIDEFSHVTLDDQVLQDNTPSYVMMNKPPGVVSATKDEQHRTVIDLLERPDRHHLHIVGRLDFNSSGLLLLTNDGRWSRQLTTPENNITKLYRVTLKKPVTEAYIQEFFEGMYFPFEDITTRPAKLHIVSDHVAEVSLMEGRYHQIKRMFGRFDNEVLTLHRIAIGNLSLDPSLSPGQSRALTGSEVINISRV